MNAPRIAIVSFPGSNGETDNLRCFWRNGFDAFVFRWNDSHEKLSGVDGYFIGAGFSYEDRGRAGMVAARDPLFGFLREEANKGKVIIGHCNGAQILVESDLIPIGGGLKMSLARNIVRDPEARAPGFLNEWIYMTPACSRGRCATSDWDGVMRIPIAHGEGRFVTKDPDLMRMLQQNDQIAFCYCNSTGRISEDSRVTPNGSANAIAGICNPAGNVVAIMPHAERSVAGDAYFLSIKTWIGRRSSSGCHNFKTACRSSSAVKSLKLGKPRRLEIFIETIIVNNEERTVERAARRLNVNLRLKQFRYIAPSGKCPADILGSVSFFNPNKELAHIRSAGKWFRWDADKKSMEESGNPLYATSVIRRDDPDVDAEQFGEGSETGICYSLANVNDLDIKDAALQEIFSNPHSSSLKLMP